MAMADAEKIAALKIRLQVENTKVRQKQAIGMGELKAHILEIHGILNDIIAAIEK
jgi:hypothetical protein